MKLRSGSALYDTIDQVVTDGVRRRLGHLSAEDTVLDGRTVRINGRDRLNLGTASYMHLERHPALVDRAAEMLRRYGTQFSASRAYLQLGLYEALEDKLGRVFGKPTLVAASTTLGHLSAIPVLVDDRDAIILDQQVHSSMQTVVQIPKARGVPVHLIRHNRLDELERRIEKLRNAHARIWYFADGIYSMFGDGAPAEQLHALMDRHPQLHCYVDDAHGFGWTGRHGCGWYRSRVPHHDRLILAVSLNKAYASAGGALVFANQADKQRVRNCGPTMIFCGPIQPPMLGSALGAVDLHLSDDIVPLQEALRTRIDHCRAGLEARGLPQVESNDTPLYFIPTGVPRLVQDVAHRLMDDGFYVNLGIFPAVPASMGGIRFHMHRALDLHDVDDFLDHLAHHWRAVLSEAGITPDKLARAFRMPHLKGVDLSTPERRVLPLRRPCLTVHHTQDINAVPATLWDAHFAGHGPYSHAALSSMAPAFAKVDGMGGAKPHFAWLTDDRDAVVAATVFCVTDVKEDMFESAEVSRRVEARRADEGADFLVTRAVVLGLPITLGQHLHLDRDHPQWMQALDQLVGLLNKVKEDTGATRVLLREFEPGADPELAQALLDRGFVEVAMPPRMTLDSMPWSDLDGWLASLKGRYRRELRKEILPFADSVDVSAGPLTDTAVRDTAYALYRRVEARGHALNVVALPRSVFDVLVQAPEFDILRFYIGGQLTGVMLSHVRDGHYSALLVGFDETYLHSHALYKVALYRTVERAKALGCRSVDLAFTAETVKKKVGARPRPTCAYALVDDTFAANVLLNV